MSGRLVVTLGLAALAIVGGVLLYLLKTSESVHLPPDAGVAVTGAAGQPGPFFPARLRRDASADANGSAGAAPAADAGFIRRLSVPNRAAKQPGPATNAQ